MNSHQDIKEHILKDKRRKEALRMRLPFAPGAKTISGIQALSVAADYLEYSTDHKVIRK